MWVEDGLIVMEYDTPISFDEILEKNSWQIDQTMI
jgi:hypothetical protein